MLTRSWIRSRKGLELLGCSEVGCAVALLGWAQSIDSGVLVAILFDYVLTDRFAGREDLKVRVGVTWLKGQALQDKSRAMRSPK